MTKTVYLTVDLHLQDWEKTSRSVWACIQPHVHDDELEVWRKESVNGTPTGWQYEVYDSTNAMSTAVPDKFVPVTLPPKINLSLCLSHKPNAGQNPADCHLLTNRRASRFKVKNPKQFHDCNHDPRPEHGLAPSPAAVGNPPLHQDSDATFPQAQNGPFAYEFSRMLADAKPAHLAPSLKLTFWGGTRWLVSADLLSDFTTWPDHVMDVPAACPDDHTCEAGQTPLKGTNIHSLVGLTFRLGGSADLTELSKVVSMALSLHEGDAPPANSWKPIDSSSGPVKRYFTDLGTLALDLDPLKWIAPQWDWTLTRETIPKPKKVSLAERVYARERMTHFVHEPQLKLAGAPAFRRRRGESAHGDSDETDLRSGKLRRWLIRREYGERAYLSSGVAGVTPFKADLEWAVYDTYEVDLVPYRQTPQDAKNGVVLALRPRSWEENAFKAEFATGAFPAGLTILTPAGTPFPMTYLGQFGFPWEGSGKVLLVHTAEKSRQALFVFQRSARVVTCQADVPGEEVETWELKPDSPAACVGSFVTDNLKFDTLTLVKGPDPNTPTLANAMHFAGATEFEFAQSLTSVEGLLLVSHDRSAPANEAEKQYRDDLVNHNALNVCMTTTGLNEPTRALNPLSELYPVTLVDGAPLRHLFHFRYAEPGRYPNAKVNDLAGYFEKLYATGATERALRLDLEHTYGTLIDLGLEPQLSAHLDFPVVLPTEARKSSPEPSKPDAFVEVAFEPGKTNAELVFQTDWLRESTKASDRRAHSDSWAAVSELEKAEKIILRVRPLSFDHRRVLEAPAPRLSAGMAVEGAVQDWDATTPVKQLVREWRSGNFKHDTATIAPPLSETPVYKLADVIEFQLRVARGSDLQPPALTWSLVRTVRIDVKPLDKDKRGFEIEDVPAMAPEQDTFKDWLMSLKDRTGILGPEKNDHFEQAADWRQVLGTDASREHADDRKEHAAWVLARKFDAAKQKTTALVCPLAFRPFANESQLGPDTFNLVARYFQLLDVLFNVAVRGDRVEKWEASDWATSLAGLETAAKDAVDKILNLLPARVLAVPDRQAGVDSVVKQAIEDLDAGKPLRTAVDARIERILKDQPRVFGDAKAFLYTGLSAPTSDGAPPAQFAQLKSFKLTRSARDNDRYDVSEALPEMARTPRFGFLEMLDDLRYSDRFTFSGDGTRSFGLSSFSALADAVQNAENADDRDPELDLDIADGLHVPGGVQPLSAGADPIPVWLPSRKVVVDPLHLFTGESMKADSPELKKGTRLERHQLLKGILNAPKADEYMELVMLSDHRVTLAPAYDTHLVSALFLIGADEEAQQGAGVNVSLSNDRFFFRVVSEITILAARPKMLAPLGFDVYGFIHDISQIDDLRNLTNPEHAFKAEMLAFIKDVVSTDAVAAEPQGAGLRVKGKDELELFRPSGLRRKEAEFFLFAAPQAALRRDPYVLMANFPATVWEKVACEMVHTRNYTPADEPPDEDRPGYVRPAPQFVSASAPVGATARYQARERVAQWNGNSVFLANRSQKVSTLLALVAQHDNQGAGRQALDPAWRKHHLVVTCHHHGIAIGPAVLAGGKEETAALHEDHHPVSIFSFTPDDSGVDIDKLFFVVPYTAFSVNFQWFTGTNQPVLRIRDFRVHVPA